jgi:hypothetical protein
MTKRQKHRQHHDQKKNRQHHDQQKKDKSTINDLQNMQIKLKIE